MWLQETNLKVKNDKATEDKRVGIGVDLKTYLAISTRFQHM